MLAGVWVIGEYGDVLISGGSFEDEDTIKEVGIHCTLFTL